uniref:Usher syndrome 2A (autosomal recessive, mild) n=1 Tax=Oncorhynchus mykiss TaxID=8022 RepID=A0A8C7Q6N4_ONCMY
QCVSSVASINLPLRQTGHFPRLENIGAHKPVTLSPSRSSCGTPKRTTYCHSPTSLQELHNCSQAFCNQECPYRSSTPPHAPLLLPAHWGTCVTQDGLDPRSRAGTGGEGVREGDGSSRSVIFRWTQGGCVASPPFQSLGHLGSFTLAVWIKPEAPGDMCVSLLFILMSFIVSLFLDGLEEDGTPFDTRPLTSPISDIRMDSTMRVGLSSNGNNKITHDIVKVYSGFLPPLHAQSECRCPPSHPRVHPLVERYCIPNAVEDTTNNRVLRLNMDAHPVSYINDQDMGTAWVSNILTGSEDMDQGLTITIDLVNGQYQVFYVILQLVSPQPEALHIQRRCSNSSSSSNSSSVETEWLDWQYMARDCSLFGLQNNGPLLRPDSVNCLQFPSDVPYSQGNITFSMLTPEPNLRPGYNDFYNTPALQQMVQATRVRIHLSGQYHTQNTGVPQRHRYYGVNEITISGRCECHGHADQCDTSVTPYRCACLPESHTEGHNCQRCAPLYNDKPFRSGDQVQAYSCRPCDCHGHALSCHYDITADAHPTEHYRGGGGVCDDCMNNTTGRSCESCVSQFYREVVADPRSEVVCQPCDCYTPGSINGSLECHPVGGQCKCKRHVSGRRCDACQVGFYSLQPLGPEGCLPCGCSAAGTQGDNGTCHQQSGRCQCKTHVIGRTCDRCDYGYKLLNSSHLDGCVGCDCDPVGSLNPFCEPEGGLCECREGVGGQRCDSCARGLYGLHQAGSCIPCLCSPDGTVPGSVCDPETGQCVCKVSGPRCDSCRRGYHSLERRNSFGCLACACDVRGTLKGGVCDPVNSQCPCREGGCVPCVCDPTGTVEGAMCDADTGQCCVCVDPSVGGRRCDQCQELHYGFNPGLGRCQACVCNSVGGVNGSCHPETGICQCKAFVTGDRCDRCVPGASHLDSDNHLGCSKAPIQQPSPVGLVLTSTSIRLTWRPPDAPNTHTLNYTLLRDGLHIHTTQRHYPFSPVTYVDSGLSPFMDYSYQLVTANVNGQTVSVPVSYQTLAAAPDPDHILLTLVGRPGPTTANLNWTRPQNTSGPQERYGPAGTGRERVHYTGLETQAAAAGLSPYTHYNLTLQACTTGGCTSTPPLPLLTSPSPPQGQPPPRVNTTGPHQMDAAWNPPVRPNGVIIRYELFIQGPMESQNTTSPAPERRVFVSSGWLDPRLPSDSAKESALPPPQSSAIVTDLQAFSTYQLRVLTVNMAGSVISDWTTARTQEGAPEFVAPPEVSAVSSSSLKVAWRSARGQEGAYNITLILCVCVSFLSQVLYVASPSERVYVAEGLEAYRRYDFTVTLCTSLGCVTSLPASGQTLPTAPAGLAPPRLRPVHGTLMEVTWDPPSQPHGPPPLYQVERTDLSLSDPRDLVVRGAMFPGNGYHRFPSDTLPVNSDFTGLRLSFRTRASDGLLLCAVSPGNQEEYLALQIRNGRPYFLFDPQVINSCNASASSGSSIIGENTGVFIGGLPEDFTLLRQDSGDAQLVQQGFSGCLRDVQVKMIDSPSEVWQPLDWSRATERVVAYESWEGCPAHTEEGAHFLGQGFLELSPDVFSGGEDFDITFEFRTDQLNALLLFSYNTHTSDYILAELEGGMLSLVLSWHGHMTELSMWAGLSYCDGGWNQLSLVKQGDVISASMNDWSEQLRGVAGGELGVDSPLYLGGVPPELNHEALVSLGGCVRGVTVRSGPVTGSIGVPDVSAVSLSASTRRSVMINLDGCPATDSIFYCRGNDSVLVYMGRETQARDLGVQPFTEYLYRVVASGEGGWTTGPWERGRSRETVPQSVAPPSSLQSGSGFSVQVSWAPPLQARGVIDRYKLTAYNLDQPDSTPVTASYLSTGNHTSLLEGLTPFTRYVVTVTACTWAGCTESPRDDSRDGDVSWSITTPEEVPEDVSPPSAVSTPSSLAVHWGPPARPNGLITDYLLYHNGQLLYQGNNTHLNITGLGVFSPHMFVLSVCTAAGCSNSSQVTLLTSQQPPGGMEPPSLTVLDSRTVYIQWSRPEQVNGVLEFYSVYLSVEGEEPVCVYNSSELFEDHTLRNLTPGTTYSFTVTACTGGGCSFSPPSEAHTEESTPENIPAPYVTPLSPHALNITWTPPDTPNGVISSYGVWMNGVLVQNSTSLWFSVDHLSPWSLHSFRVQACTAQGCALGPLVERRTLEMAPVGPVVLEVDSEGPTSLRAKWSQPATPSGNITYTLLTKGIGDDVKMSIHFSLSLSLSLSLPPAPDGVMPPGGIDATPASLQLSWLPPGRANAPGPLYYDLQMRDTPDGDFLLIIILLNNVTSTFSHTVEGLSPYTNYLFRVVVSHTHGETASDWTSLRTAEDSPGPVDPPVVSALQSHSVSVSWAPPAQPNGGITHYTLHLTSTLSLSHSTATVPGNTTSYSLYNLLPYQLYSLQVEACTPAGCTLSGESQSFHTPAAPPEGVPVPHLYSDTPTSVVLSWGAPERSNGELEGWVVERSVRGTQQVSTVVRLPPSPPPLSYLDHSSALSPWTSYQYRLVASTQAGSNTSAWANITTRPSRPAGLVPPRVDVLGPDSLQVMWSPPVIANGVIDRYEIRLPDPRVSHDDLSNLTVTVTDLVPYTNYLVTVLACSSGGSLIGGCTESLPTAVTTLPTIPQDLAPLAVVAVSESFLAVSWQPPDRPNGPNLRYELLRRKSRQPLAAQPPADLHRWFNVYAGDKLFHQDKGLSRFTWYQYQLLVYNDVGYSTGQLATGVTLAGVPLHPPSLSVQTINHTSIHISWTEPSLQDLQGEVELYTLRVESSHLRRTLTFPPGVDWTVIGDLQPNTRYRVSLQVSNGAYNTSNTEVNCTTEDGEPEGVFPPEVVPVNSSTVRVLWSPPVQPNGAVTEYSVYLDGTVHATADNTSGSYLLGGLLPFTVYDIKVEVCTVYGCVKSNATQVTTVEDLPADIAPPHIQVLSPRSVRVEWSSPGQPCGIMLGYEVWRKMLRPCGGAEWGSSVTQRGEGSEVRCSYLQCFASQGVCGASCYQPQRQVCCDGVVYTSKPLHLCCEGRYLPSPNSSHTLCCGGKLLPPLPDHQCCGRYYIPVATGEVCCLDPGQGRVSVGVGDACCGRVPYSPSGGQLCCGGLLHDGYRSQCCGSTVIEDSLVCCGDAERGMPYTPLTGLSCCGEDYLNSSTSLCCVGHDGFPRMHPAGNGTVHLQCCGSEVINQEEECCNGVGYNPHRHVCADRVSSGLVKEVRSTLCSVSAASTAYCGSCSFNPSLYIYSDLEPYTTYEYRVSASNSYGRGYSNVTVVTTNEDTPWGVAPPHWSRLGDRDDVVQLHWQAPAKPNGDISHYVVLRDGQERYRGDERSFTDVGGIRPFQEYGYWLRACNTAGCTDSSQVLAVTVQGVPEEVGSPIVTALGPASLRLSWAPPSKANGIIRLYHINMTSTGTIHTHTPSDGPLNYTVTGLQPHSDYSFVLVACTAVGCGASQPSTGRTLQDAPTGVWSSPRHVVVNSTAVELYWDQPLQPNGHVASYRLLRDGLTVFAGDIQDNNYTDTQLQPNTRYVYVLEASTGGGSGLSNRYVVQTPVSSPLGVPPPHNVTVFGPRSLFVSWTPPGHLPLYYNILLNPGSARSVMRTVGREQNLSVSGLDPYTQYHIRVQACQADGCGLGEGVYVRTSEAPPEDMDPPTVTAAGATVIQVCWNPPHKPNGLITSYFIHRRPMGTQEELLVFIWSNGPLDFIDASDALQPFRQYQYSVHAHNSRGSARSQWASAVTMEAGPEDIAPPIVTPTSAYSVQLNWTQPGQPNGRISQYRLVYRKQPTDPTLNTSTIIALTVPGSTLQSSVYGLEAFSVYSVRVEAVNGAGSVSSPWVSIRTLEASPAGLANFSLEQREQGRALLLTWDTPHTPNGVITSYNIYSEENLEFSGLSRQFLFRRLEPFSLYSLVLEACTSAGCTRTPPQSVTTAAAPPGAQPAPIPSAIGPHSVELTWSLPTHPNGPIGEYILLGRSLDDERRGNNEEIVLFRESSTQASSFSHTVTGLRPWTQYQFSIRVHNSAGHADSPWVTVTTRQAPPRGLTPPSVVHVEGNPYELLVSWTPPLESNGVLLSYRIQRDNVSFSFSFDPSVFNYTDEDLSAFTSYRYAITACTSEGCVTSPETQVKTLEAPPAAVDFPTITSITADSINVSWTIPLIQNGEVTQYMLEANGKEVYRGSGLSVVMSELRPHTHYRLILLACTNGGCTPSTPIKAQTLEAPPRGLNPPSLKVTGPESLEITWGAPKLPNGIVTGYELRRDGQVIYVGMETRYHDFALLPSVEYGYSVTANNSQGVVTSSVAKARTHPSAPSGVGPPTLQPLGPRQLRVDWEPPARPNGVIVSYTVYQRDPTLPSTHSFLYDPEHSAFSGRSIILKQLTPYHRYEVRVEACTELGCASSDWVSVLTLESPPTGQSIPLLELQRDTRGLQTIFLLSWPPPAQPNGRVLHYEVYRRLGQNTEVSGGAAALVYRNDSATCRDAGLLPYTDYQYQVWAVNSVGRSGSQWANGRTGPAPPEGVGPPTFLRILATSAVIDIRPPTRPNGIVSLYRVFSQGPNATHTLLSEGISRQQTLHGLSPYTQYWVGVEACTCYQCCSQGPVSELRTQASPPAQQPSPRPVALTSRSAQVEWDEPLAPNGLIESCELHIRSSCPQPPQPVPPLCVEGPIETRFFGRGRNYNVTGLQPYSSYQLRASCYNNMGSTASNWTTVTTLTEAPQYISPFEVYSNLTLVWLDWSASFSLNGLLRDYSLTDNNLRVYIGFHSYLYLPRTSEKTLSLQVTCTTDIGSASTPIIRYSPATGMSPVEPTPGGKQGVGTQGAPVYSEMWFILLLVFLGLLVLAVLLGLVLRRALRKEPFIRERPPLVPLQKRSQAGGDAYMGLTDSKIVGGGSRFSPMSVLRVPSQSQLSHAYSQNSLHRSVSQLIEQDRKSLMGEGGQDSGLYVEDDDFVEAIKAFSSVRKEHTMFTDTHL